MNRTRKAWVSAALMALIAPAAVVATLSGPASADADGKHRHDLDTYKREAWVALGGAVDPASVTMSMMCDTGDYALDGMWKVDAHDGDDRTVRVEYSRRNSVTKEQWDFKILNDGAGRAQVKTFVTCLDSTTGAREGHTHQILEGARVDAAANTATPGYTILEAACALGASQIPVSPSFALTPGNTARIVESYPNSAKTGWKWVFKGTDAGAVASIYCINRTTGPRVAVPPSSGGPAHTHEIDADMIPGFTGVTQTVPANTPGIEFYDYRLTSRPHDEGNVGAFKINHYDNIWYLGQDAQGQVRGFRFGNTGGAGTESVQIAVWGFDKRTTRS